MSTDRPTAAYRPVQRAHPPPPSAPDRRCRREPPRFLGGTTAARDGRPRRTRRPSTGGFKMATWIGYMDFDDNGDCAILDRFRAETGIDIDYQEAINDNEEFFASQLQGRPASGPADRLGPGRPDRLDDPAAGQPTAGWSRSTRRHPNYPANLLRHLPDPRLGSAQPVSPHRGMSGMTGLGYDQNVTGPLDEPRHPVHRTIRGQDDVPDRDARHRRAGRASTWARPVDATQDQFDAARRWSRRPSTAGIVRGITGNDYVQSMATGDVVLAIAWSGDVLTQLVPGQSRTRTSSGRWPTRAA